MDTADLMRVLEIDGEVLGALLGLVTYLLTALGYRAIFRKSGRKGFRAFLPVVREYELACVAEQEEDGRIYCILAGCYYLVGLLNLFYEEDTALGVALLYIGLGVLLAMMIYSIRVYLGLCRAFQRSRLWVVAWVLWPAFAALVWGFNNNFQPSKRLLDLDVGRAAALSGASVEAIRRGLTVNLTERIAFDFFQRKVLLRDIHLSIPTGHMVLLLGGSGAGKTTLINAFTGYEKANASVTLNGVDIYRNYGTMKYDLGFVPQQDLIRGKDTVRSTLSDAAALRLPREMPREERRERVRKMLDMFGLTSVRYSLVEKLSGGQRKRLSIAMELISDPTLFILDEPDSGLDGVVARALFRELRSIADSGKIVIVITHTPDRVIDLFDDVIVLAKDAKRTGRLAWYGPVEGARAFFGRRSMEEILLAINQRDEGGEGRADEFVERYGTEVLGHTG